MINASPEANLERGRWKERRTQKPTTRPTHSFPYHTHVASKPSLRIPSAWCFHVSAYTTFNPYARPSSAKSLIALFPDDGLISISHLTVGSVPGKSFRPRTPPLSSGSLPPGVLHTLPRISFCVWENTRARLRRWRMSPVSHSCENPERHSLAVCSTWPLRPIRSREDRKVGGRRKGYGWSLTYAAGGCGIRSSARTSLARILHQLYTAIVVKDVANWFGRQSRNYVERLAGNRRRINLIFPVICMIVSVRVSHYSLQWISKQEGGAIAISDR